jgi:hypothetical protein
MRVDGEKIDSKGMMHKDMFTGVVFPVKPHENWSVSLDNGKRDWNFGTRPPSGRVASVKGLTFHHLEVLAALMEFQDASLDRRIAVSARQLCIAVCGYQNSDKIERIVECLEDLKACWIRVDNNETGVQSFFTIIGDLNIDKKPSKRLPGKIETTIKSATLSEKWYEFLDDMKLLIPVKNEYYRRIQGNGIAKTIYGFLPSRATYRSEDQPFTIRLEKLFNEIGHEPVKYKSERFRLMTRGKNSVIEILNRSEIHQNKILRVELRETKDKKDYKLVAWSEKKSDSQGKPITSATQKFFQKECGFTHSEWLALAKEAENLDIGKLKKIKYCRVPKETHEQWILKVYYCALVGPGGSDQRFNDYMASLADSKAGMGVITKGLRELCELGVQTPLFPE